MSKDQRNNNQESKKSAIDNYIEQLKVIQKKLLQFIDNEQISQNDIINLDKYLLQIKNEKGYLDQILRFISRIESDHVRNPIFFDNIKQILKLLGNEIKTYYSNYKLIKIFQTNKRILCFLLKEGIISIEDRMNDPRFWSFFYCDVNLHYEDTSDFTYTDIPKEKLAIFFLYYGFYYFSYHENYYHSHLKALVLDEDNAFKDKIDELIGEKIEKGENDNKLCEIIRNDDIIEFQKFASRTNLDLKSKIEASPFESHQFLIDNQPSLIEYAIFFNSTNIFKYLIQKIEDIEITENQFLYAIHAHNVPFYNDYSIKEISSKSLFEAIKCHHNVFTNFFIDECKEQIEKSTSNLNEFIIRNSIAFYNYSLFPENMVEEITTNFQFYFEVLFEYNYFSIASYLNYDKLKFDIFEDSNYELIRKLNGKLVDNRCLEIIQVVINNEKLLGLFHYDMEYSFLEYATLRRDIELIQFFLGKSEIFSIQNEILTN